MSYRIIFTGPASHDLDEIADYVRVIAGPAAEERLLKEIVAAIETLRSRPSRQRERNELGRGLRGLSIKNYMIFYRVADACVSIVRVLHGSRNITSKMFPHDPG